MKQLAVCFPNVLITPDQKRITSFPEEFNIDNGGHFMNHAFHKCMQLLVKKSGWEYALLLQNHDIITKSPYEMVEIYKLLGGANDVELTACPEDRWNHSKKWDARSLKLFVNESSASPTQLNARLKFAKGATQASLSRAAVEWLVTTVNLTTLITQINEQPFGVDEILIQSLQITEELEMPGRFTSECLKQGKNTGFISSTVENLKELPSAGSSSSSLIAAKEVTGQKKLCPWKRPFGVDEILIQSLQITEELEMPGRFTSECLKQGKNTGFISSTVENLKELPSAGSSSSSLIAAKEVTGQKKLCPWKRNVALELWQEKNFADLDMFVDQSVFLG
ncbi:Core-2/I-Branching enzyme [Cooperia oncophora]